MSPYTNTTISNSTIAYTAYLNMINTSMNNYFAIVAVGFGMPGNLFAAFIFARLTRRRRPNASNNSNHHNTTNNNNNNNMGLLYTILCLVDFVSVAWIQLVYRGFLDLYMGVSLSAVMDTPFCRLSTFMRRATLHFSSWMAVLITLDRYAFVFFRNRFKSIRHNKSFVIAVVLVMLAVITVLDTPNLMFFVSPASRTCTASYDVILSSDIISIVIRTYIPLVIIVFVDYKMILKIAQKRSFYTANGASSSSGSHRTSREKLFTAAVISTGLIFFVTHFPTSIMYIVYDAKLYTGELSTNPYVSAVYNLAFNMIVNFSLFDQVFSIFTYLCFNKIFRKECLRVWAFCCPFFGSRPGTMLLSENSTASHREAKTN